MGNVFSLDASLGAGEDGRGRFSALDDMAHGTHSMACD